MKNHLPHLFGEIGFPAATTPLWSVLLICLLLPRGTAQAASGTTSLWQIGQPDTNNAEFALAPNGYGKFRDDGFFVVGRLGRPARLALRASRALLTIGPAVGRIPSASSLA